VISRDRLAAVLACARDLPDGEEKYAELQRIAAHADSGGHQRIGFAARMALLEAYRGGGQGWRAHEPLLWCLGLAGDRPEWIDQADRWRLHRQQRATIAAFCTSTRVGRAQTEELLAELRRRLPGGDTPPEVVADLSARVADHLGDEAGARRWLERGAATEADEYSDCPGCAPARRARLLAGWGQWEAAVRSAEAGLRDGPGCPAQPERNLAALMLPYLRLGRVEEATAAHLRSYRRHREEAAAFGEIGGHLRFCMLAGETERGLAILIAQLPRLAGATDELAAMEFAAAGAALCQATAGPAVAAGPDAGLPRERADALGAQLLATARQLAGAFDARNGTGHQSGRVAAWLAEPDTRTTPAQRAPRRRLPAPDTGDHDAPGHTGDHHADEADRRIPEPLSVAAVTAALRRRGCRYALDATRTVGVRSGPATVQFELAGDDGEILHARIVTDHRLPARRLAAAYAFCNWWNRDRLTPKAYVHDTGGGELVFGAGLSTDLAYGVAADQLDALIATALESAAGYGRAVAALG